LGAHFTVSIQKDRNGISFFLQILLYDSTFFLNINGKKYKGLADKMTMQIFQRR
jgi:hypothetical protein